MKRILIVLCILFCVFISACSMKSGTPSSDQILTDYNNNYSDTSFANFSKATIESESTNENIYVAYVNFEGSDNYADYQLDTDIYYTYDNKNGWVFDKRGFASLENVKCICKKGRTDIELKEDIRLNGSKYIPNGKNITYVTSEFNDADSKDYVRVTWQKQSGVLFSEYDGVLKFSYKKNGKWEYDTTVMNSEKHMIQGLENTSWQYKKNNMRIDKYPDFIINNFSDDYKTINVNFGDVTYVGYADKNENITDGVIKYTISKDTEIRSVTLNYAVNDYFEDYDDYVSLEFSGGYTKFHRIK